MIMTHKYIDQLENYHRKLFPDELKQLLLEQLGEEPEYYERSEQDIHEQSRHIIYHYFNPHVPEFIDNSHSVHLNDTTNDDPNDFSLPF